MSRSARAQATETDLEGEKVRSNPATGVRNRPPLARSSASMRARLLGPLGGGVVRRNGGHPLGHPLCQGQVGAVGLAAERLAGDRIGAHPEQIEQVLLGDL